MTSVYHAVDSSGAHHALGWTSSGNTESIDGTGIFRNYSTGVITDRNGIQYGNGGIIAEDQNGNEITVTSGGWVDTLGRTIPIPPTYESSAGSYTYNFPAENGGTVPITFRYESFTAVSDFQVPNVAEGTASLVLLYEVDLPNGTKWQFSYNTWGDLASVTLPTGGTVSYTLGI